MFSFRKGQFIRLVLSKSANEAKIMFATNWGYLSMVPYKFTLLYFKLFH